MGINGLPIQDGVMEVGTYGQSLTRERVSRTPANINSDAANPVSPTTTYSRPRRDRPPVGARQSSSAAAAAMAQSDGYKPREERGWEEFHQDLDIYAEFAVFSAAEVDGPKGLQSSHNLPTSELRNSAESPCVNGGKFVRW